MKFNFSTGFGLVHYALEEMKKSLSFISSKLVTKESRGNLGEYFKLKKNQFEYLILLK